MEMVFEFVMNNSSYCKTTGSCGTAKRCLSWWLRLWVVPCPRSAGGGTTRTFAGRGCYFIVWLTAYSACAWVNPLPALEVSCWRRLAWLNPPSWR
jgi:hypothetical protein